MAKNKIPLCLFVGVNLIAIGMLTLAAGATVFQNIHDLPDNIEALVGIAIFTSFGGGALLSGIGLVLRMKWARIIVNIILFIFIALFIVVTLLFISQMTKHFYWRNASEQISLIICIAAILSGTFLFANNTRVIDSFDKTKEEQEEG